jgi:hypothetical protein
MGRYDWIAFAAAILLGSAGTAAAGTTTIGFDDLTAASTGTTYM